MIIKRQHKHPTIKETGFSLLEILLALMIMMGIGTLMVQSMRNKINNTRATNTGYQLKHVGVALNSYMKMFYDEIYAGEDSLGNGSAEDPGPRNCIPNAATGGFNCVVTSDTLRRAGLLPPSFSGYTSYGAEYEYIIFSEGNPAHPSVYGIVLTSAPFLTGGSSTPRYDLIGVAARVAGPNAGVLETTAGSAGVSSFVGLNGAWKVRIGGSTGVYPGTYPLGVGLITDRADGILVYRTGYGLAAAATPP